MKHKKFEQSNKVVERPYSQQVQEVPGQWSKAGHKSAAARSVFSFLNFDQIFVGAKRESEEPPKGRVKDRRTEKGSATHELLSNSRAPDRKRLGANSSTTSLQAERLAVRGSQGTAPGKRQMFQKQWPEPKKMTTSTHHRVESAQSKLKALEPLASGRTASQGNVESVKSTPRVSIGIPKNLDHAFGTKAAEQNLLRNVIAAGQAKSRQLPGLSQEEAEHEGRLGTGGAGKDYSSAFPKTQRAGFTFQQSHVRSESRLNDSALGNTLPRFGLYNSSLRTLGDTNQKDKEASMERPQAMTLDPKPSPAARAGKDPTAPKEITRMKVFNPLNPTKFKTLFKKSRPSMQLVSQQQKKELIQETIVNQSSSDAEDFDNDLDDQGEDKFPASAAEQLPIGSPRHDLQSAEETGPLTAQRMPSKLKLFSDSSTARQGVRNTKLKSSQPQLNRTELNEAKHQMSSLRLTKTNLTCSEKSRDTGSRDRVVLARIPNAGQASGHVKAPGGRLNQLGKKKTSKSPARGEKARQSPVQRGSSSGSRSRSPLDTYRKNLEKRYGAKGAPKNSLTNPSGGNVAGGTRGQAAKPAGAPRSQSNLQKLEFKANQEDDAPQLAGEESDFSDDQRREEKVSPTPQRSSKLRKRTAGKPAEASAQTSRPKKTKPTNPTATPSATAQTAIEERRKAPGSNNGECTRQAKSDDDETPVQEPGILRKTHIEPAKTKEPKHLEEAATAGAQSEEDLIKVYYKLRKELDDLKEKKAAKQQKKSLEPEQQPDQATNKRRDKNNRREAKRQNAAHEPGALRASIDLELTMKNQQSFGGSTNIFDEPSKTNTTEPLTRKTNLREEEAIEERPSSITKVDTRQMPEARISEAQASEQSETEENTTQTRNKRRTKKKDGAEQLARGNRSRQEDDKLLRSEDKLPDLQQMRLSRRRQKNAEKRKEADTIVEDFVRVLDSNNERGTTEENEAEDHQAYEEPEGTAGWQKEQDEQEAAERRHRDGRRTQRALSPADLEALEAIQPDEDMHYKEVASNSLRLHSPTSMKTHQAHRHLQSAQFDRQRTVEGIIHARKSKAEERLVDNNGEEGESDPDVSRRKKNTKKQQRKDGKVGDHAASALKKQLERQLDRSRGHKTRQERSRDDHFNSLAKEKSPKDARRHLSRTPNYLAKEPESMKRPKQGASKAPTQTLTKWQHGKGLKKSFLSEKSDDGGGGNDEEAGSGDMEYIASASNNSEDLVGSDSEQLNRTSPEARAGVDDTVVADSKDHLDCSSSTKEKQPPDARSRLQLSRQQRSTNQSIRMRKSANRRTSTTSYQQLRSPNSRLKRSKHQRKDAQTGQETISGKQAGPPLDQNPDLMKYLIQIQQQIMDQQQQISSISQFKDAVHGPAGIGKRGALDHSRQHLLPVGSLGGFLPNLTASAIVPQPAVQSMAYDRAAAVGASSLLDSSSPNLNNMSAALPMPSRQQLASIGYNNLTSQNVPTQASYANYNPLTLENAAPTLANALNPQSVADSTSSNLKLDGNEIFAHPQQVAGQPQLAFSRYPQAQATQGRYPESTISEHRGGEDTQAALDGAESIYNFNQQTIEGGALLRSSSHGGGMEADQQQDASQSGSEKRGAESSHLDDQDSPSTSPGKVGLTHDGDNRIEFMVPERDTDRAVRNTTKLVRNDALRTMDKVDDGESNSNIVQNYWSKLDQKDKDGRDLPGLEDADSGSPGKGEESQLKSSNLAKLGPAVGVPYPSMMDANIQNLQQVVFGAKKGKPTPSVQTAQPALQRANNRHEGEDHSLEMAYNRGGQLSSQTADEIGIGDSARERGQESQKDFALGTNLVDDHKNFDTMTNPSIKCQDFENPRDQVTAGHRGQEMLNNALPQPKSSEVLLVGFEQKPKGKNPLTKKKTQAAAHGDADRGHQRGSERNFNSNSDQKAKIANKRNALDVEKGGGRPVKQRASRHLAFDPNAQQTKSANALHLESPGPRSARGAHDGNPSEIMSPRIIYAQKYQYRGQQQEKRVEGIVLTNPRPRGLEDGAEDVGAAESVPSAFRKYQKGQPLPPAADRSNFNNQLPSTRVNLVEKSAEFGGAPQSKLQNAKSIDKQSKADGPADELKSEKMPRKKVNKNDILICDDLPNLQEVFLKRRSQRSGASVSGRSGKSVEPYPQGSAMKKDQAFNLRANKSPQPYQLEVFDYSVSQKSINNHPYNVDGDKSVSNVSYKRGSGEASLPGGSNQKRKAKTKEELAQLRKMMMKSKFKSGMNNQITQPGHEVKSVADDISGNAGSSALNHRKGTQVSMDMQSNIEGSTLSPMASGMHLVAQRSLQQHLISLNKADFDAAGGHSNEKSKNTTAPRKPGASKNSASNFGGDSARGERLPVELLQRLASGQKALVDKKEMRKLTRSNYENLPEVRQRKEDAKKKEEAAAKKQRCQHQQKELDQRLRNKLLKKKEKQKKSEQPKMPTEPELNQDLQFDRLLQGFDGPYYMATMGTQHDADPESTRREADERADR